MNQALIISVLLVLTGSIFSCGKGQCCADSRPVDTPDAYRVAAPRKEIMSQRVLAVQLASHDEIEARSIFGPTEPIDASLYLATPSYVEPRHLLAFLVSNETVVEEQRIAVSPGDERQEFDFRFARTPRPSGSYQIRFVEVARSHGTPVLLARIFLNVE